MRRGTTPVYTMTFRQGTGAQISDICFTIKQGTTQLIRHLSDEDVELSGDMATTRLSQEDTNSFSKGTCDIQVKIKMSDGTVKSSDIFHEVVYDVLHEEEL